MMKRTNITLVAVMVLVAVGAMVAAASTDVNTVSGADAVPCNSPPTVATDDSDNRIDSNPDHSNVGNRGMKDRRDLTNDIAVLRAVAADLSAKRLLSGAGARITSSMDGEMSTVGAGGVHGSAAYPMTGDFDGDDIVGAGDAMQDAMYLLKHSYGDADYSTIHDHPDCNGDDITGVTGALPDAIYLLKHANSVSGYETLYPGVLPTLSSAARINDTHINVTMSEDVTALGGEDGGFIVAENGDPLTNYTVSAIVAGGSAEFVILTVADMAV